MSALVETGGSGCRTKCASWTLVVFGHAFGSLQGIANIEGEGGVGNARRSVFNQVDGMRAGKLAEVEVLAADDYVLAVERHSADTRR